MQVARKKVERTYTVIMRVEIITPKFENHTVTAKTRPAAVTKAKRDAKGQCRDRYPHAVFHSMRVLGVEPGADPWSGGISSSAIATNGSAREAQCRRRLPPA